MTMEVLSSSDHIVLRKGVHSLWFNRAGSFKCEPKKDVDFSQHSELLCLGQAVLLIGQVQQDKLLLATRVQTMGKLPTVNGKFMHVHKIRRVCLLPLFENVDLQYINFGLGACSSHANNDADQSTHSQVSDEPDLLDTYWTADPPEVNTPVSKTWNSIKSTSGRIIGKSSPSQIDPRDRMNRRIQDEIIKMFSEADNFYYSEDGDLTSNVQRTLQMQEKSLKDAQKQSTQSNLESTDNQESDKVTNKKKQVTWDERFFFNEYMLSFLPVDHPWYIRIVQGFVQIERVRISLPPANEDGLEEEVQLELALISRRSKHRAGTRYKRRGVDEQGYVANYVETEQLLATSQHLLSFVQIRGSIPVYWAQPGLAYRPAPVLERSVQENAEAFQAHFLSQFARYQQVCAINLVEQTGREKPLGDAYLNQVLDLDDERLTYVSFDFHEMCRGMHFENVALLVESLSDLLKDMRYCWSDHSGLVCEQRGVFRVNCVDCLDRTNLVQSALAKAVLQTQLSRLALLPPEQPLPISFRRAFQALWANHGDAISRQYAGTSALKGDFTRTGERRLAGLMKDSYNSATRYYQNRFRDAYRQAAIDTLLGHSVSVGELGSPDSEAPILGDEEREERIRHMLEHCRSMCVPDGEPLVGCWALLDDHLSDAVLMLSKDCYYLAQYDELRDRVQRVQCVLLEDVERIEFGPEASAKEPIYSLRIHYLFHLHTGYFHLLRAHPAVSGDPQETLREIVQSLKLALSVRCMNVPLFEGKLERRRSKRPDALGDRTGSSAAMLRQARQLGERNLRGLRTAGSKAISNVSSQFARFKLKFGRARAAATESAVDGEGLSSEDEEVDDEEEEDEEDEDELENTFDSMHRPLEASSSASTNASVFDTSLDRQSSSDYSEIGVLGKCTSPSDEPVSMPPMQAYGSVENSEQTRPDTLLESCGILSGAQESSARRPEIEITPADTVEKLENNKHNNLGRPLSRSTMQLSNASKEISGGSTTDGLSIVGNETGNLNSASCASIACIARSAGLQSDDSISARLASFADEARIESGAGDQLSELKDYTRSNLDISSRLCTSRTVGTTRMKNSQSVCSIQEPPNAWSPSAEFGGGQLSKRDLIFNPLNRIARGVQHLNLTRLNPQQLIRRTQPLATPMDEAEYEQLRKRKEASRSKIIEI